MLCIVKNFPEGVMGMVGLKNYTFNKVDQILIWLLAEVGTEKPFSFRLLRFFF